MSFTRSIHRRVLLLALPLALGACSLFSPAPTVARVNLAADSRLNQDVRKRSTPVVVRVYLLKNLAAFAAADFFSLYEKDQQVLADALVWREEMILQPGEVRRLEPREAGEGKFVAVLAAFRNIDRATWRSSVQLLPHKTNEVAILAREDSIIVGLGVDPAQLKPAVPQLKAPEAPTPPARPGQWSR